ncbi:hypothetical protein LEMLEM_LOCUS22144 [Lemmus lemmus]
MSKFSKTGRNPQVSTTGCREDSRANDQNWLWEQQENQACAASWLLEVSGSQYQGSGDATDVQQILLC